MYVIHCYVTVKPGTEAEFAEVCAANSAGSLQEPGCVRFDVLQQADDPTKFTLAEAYHDESDLQAHKETEHYKAWAEVCNRVQAEPRSKNVFTVVAGL